MKEVGKEAERRENAGQRTMRVRGASYQCLSSLLGTQCFLEPLVLCFFFFYLTYSADGTVRGIRYGCMYVHWYDVRQQVRQEHPTPFLGFDQAASHNCRKDEILPANASFCRKKVWGRLGERMCGGSGECSIEAMQRGVGDDDRCQLSADQCGDFSDVLFGTMGDSADRQIQQGAYAYAAKVRYTPTPAYQLYCPVPCLRPPTTSARGT